MILTNKRNGAKGLVIRECKPGSKGERRLEVQIIKAHHWYKKDDIVIWKEKVSW